MHDATKVDSLEELRDIYPEPNGRPVDKQIDHVDAVCRRFIALSPFLVLGTEGDVSPKGDAPGFVHVIDDHTLLLPDRKGNNRLDSMTNILTNPKVGLIFLIPGVNETLRINGRAEIIDDLGVLEAHAVRGQVPKSGLLIHVDEAFLHCAKALIRSDFWNPEKHLAEGTLPSGGALMAEMGDLGDPEEHAESYAKGLVEKLY